MTYLVDANVLSEPTKPAPNNKVIDWLAANEGNLVVDSIVATRNTRDFNKTHVQVLTPSRDGANRRFISLPSTLVTRPRPSSLLTTRPSTSSSCMPGSRVIHCSYEDSHRTTARAARSRDRGGIARAQDVRSPTSFASVCSVPLDPTRRQSTPLDAIADLIGSVDGLPADLSARKKRYLKATGYGQKRSR